MTAVLATTGNAAPRLLRPARWATRAQFFVLGFSAGIWGVHIPTVKTRYGLSEGSLSLALFAAAVGAVLCLSLAGRIVSALGARVATLVAGLVLCAALATVAMVALLRIFPEAPTVMLLVTHIGAGAGVYLATLAVLYARSLLQILRSRPQHSEA